MLFVFFETFYHRMHLILLFILIKFIKSLTVCFVCDIITLKVMYTVLDANLAAITPAV